MYELFIGPWNLDPFQIGEKFDVKKFIENAEIGKYDGPEPARLNREAPWYQQLKIDVENGVYDEERMADEERVFRVWLDEMLLHDPNADRDPVDKWYQLFVMANDWVIKAMAITNSIPANLWMNRRGVNERFMKYPESGWR